MNSSFSISEAFSYGWDTFKKNWKFLVPYFVILGLIQIVFSYLSGENSPLGPISFLVNILSIVVSIFISASMVKTMLMLYDNKTVSLSKNIFCITQKEFIKYLRVLLATSIYLFPFYIPLIILTILPLFGSPADSIVVFSLFILSSTILVICIPIGIIIFLGIIFSNYISLSYNFGIFGSVKYSQKITKENRFKIFLLMLVSGLVILLGLICLGVGLLVAVPVVSLAQVYVYKKLDAAYVAKNGVTVPTPVPVPQANDAVTDIEIQPEEITAPHVEDNKSDTE